MTRTLELKEVGVRFQGLQALRDVSFSIAQGELVALIGPNGAGKSTLINVISGTLAASSGRVAFGAAPVRGGAPHLITRRGLVRSFQGLDLFESLTVEQNVIAGGAMAGSGGFWRSLLRFGSRDPVARRLHEKAAEALALVGLSDRAQDPAAILPAGQRRLLAIARALLTEADWLVLDEPGAGLNETEKLKLIQLIRRLHEDGRTILFVEHDMEMVGHLARRILVLDHGQLIADGATAAVRCNEQVIAAYLGADLQRLSVSQPLPGPRPPPLLEATGLNVSYGDVTALRDVALQVGAGELVAVVGANGAGKSTLLKALAGAIPKRGGQIHLDGRPVTGASAESMVGHGVALVPEGRELFAAMTVQDNLLLGRWSRTGSRHRWGTPGSVDRAARNDGALDEIYTLFPRLQERRHQAAGALSGGEAQMLAIGRALMSRPRILLLDEPSLGLAPMLIEEIFGRLQDMRRAGLGILLVEQLARVALAIADYGYLLELGRLVREGAGRSLLDSEHLTRAYLGGEAEPSMSPPAARAALTTGPLLSPQ